MLDELVMQVKRRNGAIHAYDQTRVRPSILGNVPTQSTIFPPLTLPINRCDPSLAQERSTVNFNIHR